jgi:tRNA A-37 threonylcarbamoyl transferase component Bud32
MAWPSHFDKLRGGDCTLYVHKDFRNYTFEQALLAGGKELHKRYHPIPVPLACGVCKFGVRFGGVEKMVYLKEYFYRSAWDFVKHLFRHSRAVRALKAELMLAENGFESPCVIAVGQHKFAFLTTKSFMVTLEVENARSVYQLVSAAERLQERRSFIRALGRTVGRMHAEGIFHGDLRPGNVLARKEGDNWRIFFLDNERTRKFRKIPERLRLKNLVQINMFEPGEVSNTDRMRFFKEYWVENKKGDAAKTALIKKILKKTARRLRKELRFDV